jgi:hypothetical protein
MAQQISLNNENIIKLIFYSIEISNSQRLLDRTTGKVLSKIILSILNSKDMFKSIGKNKIILKADENWIRSTIVLSENLILLCSFDNKTLKVWNINDLRCTAAIEEETYDGSLLKLQDGNIAIGCINSINIRNVNDGLKCIRIIFFGDYSHYSDLKLLTDSRIAFTAYRPGHNNSLIVTNLGKDSSFSKVVDETEDLINPIATWSNVMTSNSSHDNAIKVWSIMVIAILIL